MRIWGGQGEIQGEKRENWGRGRRWRRATERREVAGAGDGDGDGDVVVVVVGFFYAGERKERKIKGEKEKKAEK